MNRRTVLLLAACAIMSAQAVYSHMVSRKPFLPSPPPLSTFPRHLGSWSEIQEEQISGDALEALGPDDSAARLYGLADGPGQAQLFIAYYKTQLRSKNAHDPKVCLPGAGWNPVASQQVELQSGAARPLPVNYYRIKKEARERVVLYWFQTFSGVYTLEQQLKAHRLWDAVFQNRTDMALVRIIVPVTPAGIPAADALARSFAPTVYNQMLQYFPENRNGKL